MTFRVPTRPSAASQKGAVGVLSQRVRCLQEPLVHVNRSIEDDRELCRRANADRDPEIEFRLELNKEVRAKDASDCHAGLQVVRDRISCIEGSCAVINTRFQERDRLYQQLRSQQRHDDEFRLPAADLEQELNHGDC